ncbi:hypothetical protein EEJ31_01365 [Cryobacterium tepidiphilum]|uniref:Uncharacterized protein n=2 Tax=Cryobacterium tepidiphilum TaxID=2486026 RepID=A0A3M8LRQ6_9MICO|nr:hypothetical protein EEJ31_01365 [Cryobacterium tepidiphilum]
MMAATEVMNPDESLVEYAARRDEVVADTVRKVLEVTDGTDAFDVIELMRQRGIVAPRLGVQDENFDASAAAIEVLAVILLARGERSEGGSGAQKDRAQISIEILHNLTTQVLGVGNLALLAQGELAQSELSQLAADYQGSILSIRNRQYSSIHGAINGELFGGKEAIELGLGFSYSDFIAVRESIDDEYLDGLNAAMAEFGEVAVSWAADTTLPQSPETIRRGSAEVPMDCLSPRHGCDLANSRKGT